MIKNAQHVLSFVKIVDGNDEKQILIRRGAIFLTTCLLNIDRPRVPNEKDNIDLLAHRDDRAGGTCRLLPNHAAAQRKLGTAYAQRRQRQRGIRSCAVARAG